MSTEKRAGLCLPFILHVRALCFLPLLLREFWINQCNPHVCLSPFSPPQFINADPSSPDPEALADSDTEDIKFNNGSTFKVQMLPPEQQNNEMPIGSDGDMYKFVEGFEGKPAFLKIMTSEGDELGEAVKKENEYGKKVCGRYLTLLGRR